jgi:hypothetical protein
MSVIATRRVVLLPAVLLLLAACDADHVAGPPVQPPPGPEPIPLPTEPIDPIDAPVRLAIPTYDGSGQVVHPDVIAFATPWQGASYWMAVTPYPGGDAGYENPSVVVSADGLEWGAPDGLTNPVVPRPVGGHNSDPDLVYDAAGNRLVLVYRTVTGGQNVIQSMTSTDGRHWSAPAVVLSKPNHQAVAPSVTFADANRPMLWYVDSGSGGCNASVTTVRLRVGSSPSALWPSQPDAGWSSDVATTLGLDGRVVWHVDVIYAAAHAEFWAVFHAYERGQTCGSGDLFFARSRDGVAWTVYPTPLLEAGGSDWTGASLYRASLAHDVRRDVLRVWFSARSQLGAWSAGLVEFSVPALLQTPVQSLARAGRAGRQPPHGHT